MRWRRSPALPISTARRAIRLPTITYTSAAMPQLIAMASLWSWGLNMPLNGPTSERAASCTLETIELDGFALRTISRMPATMIPARTHAARRIRRASQLAASARDVVVPVPPDCRDRAAAGGPCLEPAVGPCLEPSSVSCTEALIASRTRSSSAISSSSWSGLASVSVPMIRTSVVCPESSSATSIFGGCWVDAVLAYETIRLGSTASMRHPRPSMASAQATIASYSGRSV